MESNSPDNTGSSFSHWLDQLRDDARAQGISQATIDAALTDITPLPNVVERDRAQPETTLTLESYLSHIVTAKNINQGKALSARHHTLLAKIGKEYGVQPRFIVALWGIESQFGKHSGTFSEVQALATLAYDGRRSDFFRDELIKALKIIDAGDITAAGMKGSWAGAMGQCQFMPSSFLNFAVDEDGDGKRDIWKSLPDVFGSIANYLAKSGWRSSEGWGRPVKLPEGFDLALADIKQTKSLIEWEKMGVRRSNGGSLPKQNVEASLIMVGDGDDAKPYLVYNNYKVLLKWNRSRYFATAVGMLADQF